MQSNQYPSSCILTRQAQSIMLPYYIICRIQKRNMFNIIYKMKIWCLIGSFQYKDSVNYLTLNHKSKWQIKKQRLENWYLIFWPRKLSKNLWRFPKHTATYILSRKSDQITVIAHIHVCIIMLLRVCYHKKKYMTKTKTSLKKSLNSRTLSWQSFPREFQIIRDVLTRSKIVAIISAK